MASLNLNQIEEKLNKEFAGSGRRLVFWYDDKADFAEEVDNLKLKMLSYIIGRRTISYL